MDRKEALDALHGGIAAHNAGKLVEAERLYRAVLKAEPQNAVALHHLGIIAVQCGHAKAAIDLMQRSLKLEPNAAAYSNLGEAFRALERFPEAVEAYRKALAIDPSMVDAMANLGASLTVLTEYVESEELLQKVLAIAPNHITALIGMATMHTNQSNHEDSLKIWQQIVSLQPNRQDFRRSLGGAWILAGDPYRGLIELRGVLQKTPDDPETHSKISLAYERLNNIPEAILSAKKVVGLRPNIWQTHHDLGVVLQRVGDFEGAVTAYEEAIKLNPTYASLHAAYGSALSSSNRLNEAADEFAKATELDPKDHRLLNGLSAVRFSQCQYTAAVEVSQRAVALAPKDFEAHATLSFAMLAAGMFEQGFQEYEWRWRDESFSKKPRDFDRPLWDGSDPRGRRILVHSEQGFGDIFQFLRYILLVRARGAIVYVETTYKVAHLVRRMPIDVTVYIQGTMLPDFDIHIPMLSLPALFNTTTQTIPCVVPYLVPDPELVEQWKQRINRMPGVRVGLVWAGNQKPDPKRSAKLEELAALGEVEGVSLISMQAPPQSSEANEPPTGMKVENIGPELRDFSDTTASLLANLDLFISIDTGVAHLAAAMGVQTWILLPWSRDWRWVIDDENTRWYPTVRTFRQDKRDDWSGAVQRVVAALRQLIASKG